MLSPEEDSFHLHPLSIALLSGDFTTEVGMVGRDDRLGTSIRELERHRCTVVRGFVDQARPPAIRTRSPAIGASAPSVSETMSGTMRSEWPSTSTLET
jgi:hypothetical protein